MFTEGLDESSINWINQGSDVEKSQLRSPLTEKYDKEYTVPRSPLGYSSGSSHALPPLKFHSCLLGPHNPVALSLESSEDDYGDADSESVASVPDELDGICSDEGELNKPIPLGCNEEMFTVKTSTTSDHIRGISRGLLYGAMLNRGLLKQNLRIEVPENTRRYTDTELGFEGCGQKSAAAIGSCQLREVVQPHSAYATPIGKLSDIVDLGTPSAPPIMEISREEHSSAIGSACSKCSWAMPGFDQTNEVSNTSKESAQKYHGVQDVFPDQNEQSLKHEVGKRDENGMKLGETEALKAIWETKPRDCSPYYDASDQNAWQLMMHASAYASMHGQEVVQRHQNF